MVSGTLGSKESGQVCINTGGGSDNDSSLLTVLAWAQAGPMVSRVRTMENTVVAGEWLEGSASRGGSSSRSEWGSTGPGFDRNSDRQGLLSESTIRPEA